MDRNLIIEELEEILDRKDFFISKVCNLKSTCFDLLARRDVLILLLKVLDNIDAIVQEQSQEIITLAHALSASPVLVGNKTRNFSMEDGIVYKRYGFFAVTVKTFEDALTRNYLPAVMSRRGGYYVNLDGNSLKEAMVEYSISRGVLAKEAGVSRKSLYNYENENTSLTLDTALKIEEYLDVPLVKPVDFFSPPKDYQPERHELEDPLAVFTVENLSQMGFHVYPTNKAPFSALSKSEDMVLITKLLKKKERGVGQKMEILRSLSNTLENEAFLLTAKKVFKENIEGVPVLKKEELRDFGSPDELIDTVLERKSLYRST